MLKEVKEIAREAGAAIMDIYRSDDFDVQKKADDSPLTKADLAAHNIICDGLRALDIQYPVISEESSNISWAQRKHWCRYWLVDPLDGTKEFIKRNDEFTVNIALIEKGVPILGVVYAPALNAMYTGERDRGAFLNDKVISVASRKSETLRVVGSRSHPSQETTDWLDALDKPYEMLGVGSSLKFCLVAEGKADIYPRLGPTSEWDTAAAHAVLGAAGGEVTTVAGAPLLYNQKEDYLNPHFIAR
ncbi:3'(2'),5'-bisphosphate nucleotidase CysQ [Idiomarina loihiensis]|uniref:3'(2'),5'-bisphosphate nucleotidase CysQ n=1 Tax=Idiomarina TaxID=135575 RepID=UPI000309BE72|nr:MULTISPECIES: 3'(2'),5'-bisphosphate nucleotidase CysQ [unclassified Idiomarina]NWO01494.1 3'(2'),5'-bisphosphate nucleotidase CysQ [Idiomarinaceae bacterium]HAS22476.1 3'(2'),5'-bisphosphate nucleotidase [Idiomarina loihiensis]|tara:strand:- start:7119 stop:7853 length:735 start_codon:yes stop_codon:yes gene_type:complete